MENEGVTRDILLHHASFEREKISSLCIRTVITPDSPSSTPLTPIHPPNHPRSNFPDPRSLRRLALPEAEQRFLTPVGVRLGSLRRCRRARYRQTCPKLSTRRAPSTLARERAVVVGRGAGLILQEACLDGPLAVDRHTSRGHGALLLNNRSLSSMGCLGRYCQSMGLEQGLHDVLPALAAACSPQKAS
jgi:hypothetical protein